MVSSALPHSRHSLVLGRLLVLPVAHERRPVYELAPLPLFGGVGKGSAHRGNNLVEGDVRSYVTFPVFNAVRDFVFGDDGREVGCDGMYGEVG
jgi:hypothetical protein